MKVNVSDLSMCACVLQVRDRHVQELQTEILTKDGYIQQKDQQLQQKDGQLQQLRNEKNQNIHQKELQIQQKDTQIQQIENELVISNEQIQYLQNLIQTSEIQMEV